jgi:hypothetical protein
VAAALPDRVRGRKINDAEAGAAEGPTPEVDQPMTVAPVVYLAGPMSGCNEAQRTEWRRLVKEHLPTPLTLIDPTDTPVERGRSNSRFELARQDAEAIRKCDAVLANMWKESIGTAIGVVEARRAGKIVVIVDPNHIQSSILAYFADAVAHGVEEGLSQLITLLQSQRSIQLVTKADGVTQEPFSREKLARSLRAACTAARRNDVLCVPEIVPRVMQVLLRPQAENSGTVTSSSLREAVFEALAELEGDPHRGEAFRGIREAWERYLTNRRKRTAPDKLSQLMKAYEGTDWEGRIVAEVAISGQCPMNALLLCTKFEGAWVDIARQLRVIPKIIKKSDVKLSSQAFHAIAVVQDKLLAIGALPSGSRPFLRLLATARRDRNEIVHEGAFSEDRALRLLAAVNALNAVKSALAQHPQVANIKLTKDSRMKAGTKK